jgi:xanthine dehydrogenase large subunit
MLAISVREALRDAVSAFGQSPAADLACPATPEQVFFAVRRVRAGRPALQ